MPVFYQDPKIENAAVFIANVVRNDDVYSSDKTMAEILKAYDEGKFVIFDVNDSGYHFIFTEGTIALTNRTPYQGVFIFGNAMASFSADNATTENNVDYFNMTLESSGSTLPETTEDDNGKVLKVQDGAWAIGDDESTPIEVYNSLDSVPDDLPDGSFVIIPSEEEDSGESDLIDFTQIFDFAEALGGVTVREIDSELGQELVDKLREKGFVKINIAFNGEIGSMFVGIVDFGSAIGICKTFRFYDELVYIAIVIDEVSITFEIKKLTTSLITFS